MKSAGQSNKFQILLGLVTILFFGIVALAVLHLHSTHPILASIGNVCLVTALPLWISYRFEKLQRLKPCAHEHPIVISVKPCIPSVAVLHGHPPYSSLVLYRCPKCDEHMTKVFTGLWQLEDFTRRQNEIDDFNGLVTK